METADVNTIGSWSDDADRQAWFDMMHDVAFHQHTVRSLAVFYPFVTLTALFKPFSGQPRLALMVNTLTRSFSDLAHFLVVFLTIVLLPVHPEELPLGPQPRLR